MSDSLIWRRMPAFALVYFSGQFVTQMLNQMPLIAAGLVAMVSIVSLPLPYVVAVLIAVMLLSALAHYWSFSYIQQHDRFLVRRGILSRERIELPFARVQNINIKQPFYYRPFKLVILGVDTAGSAGKEVEIAALGEAEAQRIKRTILLWRPEQSEPTEEQTVPSSGESESNGALLVHRSVKDIMLHGFTNNRAWLLLAVAAPLWQQVEQRLAGSLQAVDVDVQGWLAGQDVLSISMLASVILVALFVFFSFLSIAGALLTLYDYRLFFDRDTYIRQSGLFNRYEIRVQQRRVQTLQCAQTWLEAVFSRVSLVLEPFAIGRGESQGADSMRKIMVPSLRYQEASELIEHQCPRLNWQALVYQSIHPLYMLHKMLFTALPVACLIAFWFGTDWVSMVLVGGGVWTACFLLIYVRWLRYGVAVSEGYLLVRSGFIGQKVFCVPTLKAQQLSFIQSLFMRRRDLAHLQLVTASRTVVLPYIHADLAKRLLDEVLADVEVLGESWM